MKGVSMFDLFPDRFDFFPKTSPNSEWSVITTRPIVVATRWRVTPVTNNSITYFIELPGCKEEGIRVSIDQGNLIVSGGRADTKIKFEESCKLTHVPDGAVSYGEVKASFEDCVLRVTFDVTPVSNEQVIPINK